MVVDFIARFEITRTAVTAVTLRDIHLAPDDGLDVVRLHRVVERDCAVHVAVVGDGTGGKVVLRQMFGERFDLNRRVEQAVVCM